MKSTKYDLFIMGCLLILSGIVCLIVEFHLIEGLMIMVGMALIYLGIKGIPATNHKGEENIINKMLKRATEQGNNIEVLPHSKLWDKENRKELKIRIIIAISILILFFIDTWIWPGRERFSWPGFIFWGICTAWWLYILVSYPYWLIERD